MITPKLDGEVLGLPDSPGVGVKVTGRADGLTQHGGGHGASRPGEKGVSGKRCLEMVFICSA